jgi:hypothetical protein
MSHYKAVISRKVVFGGQTLSLNLKLTPKPLANSITRKIYILPTASRLMAPDASTCGAILERAQCW